ncbi:MAG: hypothetical protein Q8807_03560, partial ['Waltheria sp.' little leaf phytoplasma]|nr:hypothetical protein ['Waltheria sp.' little leaf phytoplasma]
LVPRVRPKLHQRPHLRRVVQLDRRPAKADVGRQSDLIGLPRPPVVRKKKRKKKKEKIFILIF